MEKSELRKDDQGLFAVAVNSAGTLGEKTVTHYFGLLRDVRAEVNHRTTGGIDWIEGAQQGVTRLLRSVNQRVDDVWGTLIDSGERIALGAVRTAHTTGNGAADLASRTASSLTGTRRDVTAQA